MKFISTMAIAASAFLMTPAVWAQEAPDTKIEGNTTI
jgi:hypothetical protein